MLNPVSLGWSFASTRSQFIPQETAELSTGKMVQETQVGPPRAPWGAQRVQRRAQQPPTRCQVGKCTTCLKQKLSFSFIPPPPRFSPSLHQGSKWRAPCSVTEGSEIAVISMQPKRHSAIQLNQDKLTSQP